MSIIALGLAAVWVLAVLSVWALIYAHGEREREMDRRAFEEGAN